MLPMASLPENSNDSAGSSEMMSSICLAMTTVSFGVAAPAGPPGQAKASATATIRYLRILDSFLVIARAALARGERAGELTGRTLRGGGRRVKPAARRRRSLDHLVRPHEHRRRDRQLEGLRGLQVDHHLELRRLLD